MKNQEMISTSALLNYPNNAKKHPQKQIDIIKSSIKEFGFRQYILIDKDNTIIAGHGRLMAAKELGMHEVPCIRIDDLTPEQIKAYRIMDNKSQESGWNNDLLKNDFDYLTQHDFDLNLTGFADIDIEKVYGKPGEVQDIGHTEVDKVYSHLITCPKCKHQFKKKDGKKNKG